MASVLTVLWYLGVWLLCYRKKGTGEESDEPLQHHRQDKVDELDENLMGRSAPEPGTQLVSSDELGFAGDGNQDNLGVVADLQQEIRLACRELESELASKEVFLERFAALIGTYPPPSELKEALADFVREQVPFFIEQEELERIGL